MDLSLSLAGDGIDDVRSSGHCGVLGGVAQVSQCGSLPERVSQALLCSSAGFKLELKTFWKQSFKNKKMVWICYHVQECSFNIQL